MREDNRFSAPPRRDFLRILAAGGAGVAARRLGLPRGGSHAVAQESRTLMGTLVNLTVVSADREAGQAAVEATLARMTKIESQLSRYREDSEVSRLATSGRIDDASDALLDVLRLGERISRMGDGAFDVTVQPEVDLYREHLAAHQALPPRAEI